MRKTEDIAMDLAKAAFKRKTSMGRANKVIDAFFEDNPILDEAAHFVNEVLIHGKPRAHIRNTIKYNGIPKIIKQILEGIK